MSSDKFRRVNVLIRQDQYDEIMSRGLSVSGLIRDLLDDRFSETTITLSVTRESKAMYDNIVSNFGVSDAELAGYVVEALDGFLQHKEKEIERLRAELQRHRSGQKES